jgi:hypothetical protein
MQTRRLTGHRTNLSSISRRAADLIATDSSEEQKEYAMKFEVTGPQPVIDACTALSLHADGHVSPVSPVRSRALAQRCCTRCATH